MVSKVELANMALDLLAVDPIAALNESSSPARKVTTHIDRIIEAVLEMSDWTFARKITALANVDNLDWTERYEFKYDLPNDLLKAIKLVPAIDAPNTLPISYSLANGSLYTNEQDAKLRYTWRNSDPTRWPMSFAEAVSIYLARSLAMPLTRKRSNFIDMNGLFNEQLAKAIEFDAGQEQHFWGYPSEYLEARGADERGGDGRGTDGSSYWSN